MSDSSENKIDNREIKITIDPKPSFDLYFNSMDGHDELGRPFHYTLDLISNNSRRLDLRSLVGSKITIALQLDDAAQKRYFNGIIASAGYTGLVGGQFHYSVEMRPWIWLLSRKQDYKIYQKTLSALDIIKQVFSDNSFSDVKDSTKNSSNYKQLDFCVQYRETCLDFVTRLMEKYGIYYYFEHTETSHTLVLCDDPGSHTATQSGTLEFFESTGDYFRSNDYFWEWQATMTLQSGTVAMTDYNFTTPSANMLAKTVMDGTYNNYGTIEMFEFPTGYVIKEDGIASSDVQTLTNVRAQELDARREVVQATGNMRELGVGYLFTLEGFEEDPGNTSGPKQNRQYLTVSSTYALRLLENNTDTESQHMFQSTITAIPNDGKVFFRLPRLTPRPIVAGPQTAKVVGASGDEITTDKYGRVKLKFFWDRVGADDDTASCWIRVSQAWAGVSWGSMILPRVGEEVIVEFIDGDPDQPIVTGRLYNATRTVPYPLPDNKTRSTFKTSSSTGGSGFNEIRFEDKAGSEEVFFQAQKDYNKVVLNNETVKITQDTTTTVEKGNRVVDVQKGNDTLTVDQGNREVMVTQGADKLTVSAGDLTIDVTAGTAKVTAGTKISLGVGANTIVITTSDITLTVGSSTIKLSASGVDINGPQINGTANAKMALNGGGMMELQAGLIKIN